MKKHISTAYSILVMLGILGGIALLSVFSLPLMLKKRRMDRMVARMNAEAEKEKEA